MRMSLILIVLFIFTLGKSSSIFNNVESLPKGRTLFLHRIYTWLTSKSSEEKETVKEQITSIPYTPEEQELIKKALLSEIQSSFVIEKNQ